MNDFALEFVPGGPDKKAEKPDTNFVEQAMSGVNTGLAKFAGTPVDLVAMALNAGIGGANRAFGSEIPTIDNPVGGSGNMLTLMDPTISDVEPQTAAQRYGRRVGEEVGYGVPASMTMASVGPLAKAAQTNLPAFMGANAASDVGAGLAGQLSRDIAPESDVADFVATMIGGTGTAALANRMATRAPKVQSRADLQQQTDDLYDAVKNSGADLNPSAQNRFNTQLQQRFAAEGGDPLAYPKANAQLNVIQNNPRQSVYGVEQARRRVRDKVARSPDESAIGNDLVKEINDYLESLAPGDIRSNSIDPEEVVGTLKRARKVAHQGIKADEITDAMNKAENRASTTGTGGNILNAQSQEIRKIYDKEISLRNPQKSGGYTPDEVEAMKAIVQPKRGERILRGVGRFSPSTGNLQASLGLFGGGGGLATAAMSGNPVFAAAAAPSLVGMAAQSLAERAKSKNIEKLVQTILNNGIAVKPQRSEAVRAAIVSQLLNSTQEGR